MKLYFKGLLCILALSFWIGCVHAAEPAGDASQKSPPSAEAKDPPVLVMPETGFDFGEAMEGGDISHDFIVKNTGKADLQIDQVRPG